MFKPVFTQLYNNYNYLTLISPVSTTLTPAAVIETSWCGVAKKQTNTELFFKLYVTETFFFLNATLKIRCMECGPLATIYQHFHSVVFFLKSQHRFNF